MVQWKDLQLATTCQRWTYIYIEAVRRVETSRGNIGTFSNYENNKKPELFQYSPLSSGATFYMMCETRLERVKQWAVLVVMTGKPTKIVSNLCQLTKLETLNDISCADYSLKREICTKNISTLFDTHSLITEVCVVWTREDCATSIATTMSNLCRPIEHKYQIETAYGGLGANATCIMDPCAC